MSDLVDPNKIAAHVVSEIAKDSFNCILNSTSRRMKTGWQIVFEDFTEYSERVYAQNKNIRIVCLGDKDVDLYEIYTPGTFRNGREEYSDTDLVQLVRDRKNVILTGSGGSGKTLFMRHLWLTIFENPVDQIPIFIELRSLNSLTDQKIEPFIRLTISQSANLTEESFNYFCDKGSFCFLLDGIDELNEINRDSISEQIIKFSRKFPKCSFFVTSRPDNTFSGWSGFNVLRCNSFDFNQSKELIQKIPFDPEKRRVFLKEFDREFFDKYETFLSSPLLCMIFMMIFRDQMQIPEKMTIFYDAAFTALYTTHDSVKMFSREKNLDRNKFQEMFSVFCFLSYYDEVFEFNDSNMQKYLDKAQSILQTNYDTDNLIKDFTKNVCLMIQDGWSYFFIHRSFQEYFAAKALVTIFSPQVTDLADSIDRPFDLLLPMAYEQDEEKILHDYIKPTFESIFEGINKNYMAKKPFSILQKLDYSTSFFIESSRVGCSVYFSAGSMKIAKAMSLTGILMGIKENENIMRWNVFNDFMFQMRGEIESDISDFKIKGDKVYTTRVKMNFDENEIIYKLINEDELNSRLLSYLEGYYSNKMTIMRDGFSLLSKTILSDLRELSKIYENRIEKSKNKKKSMDEIIGKMLSDR